MNHFIAINTYRILKNHILNGGPYPPFITVLNLHPQVLVLVQVTQVHLLNP